MSILCFATWCLPQSDSSHWVLLSVYACPCMHFHVHEFFHHSKVPTQCLPLRQETKREGRATISWTDIFESLYLFKRGLLCTNRFYLFIFFKKTPRNKGTFALGGQMAVAQAPFEVYLYMCQGFNLRRTNNNWNWIDLRGEDGREVANQCLKWKKKFQ